MRTDSNILTTAEVAGLFRVHRNTVGAWVKAGMPCYRASAKHIRFDLNQVKDWMKANGKSADAVTQGAA